MVDLNLTGGPTVFKDFTPSAFKYDSSSFYNFEQDNLPVWDLEDRTNFNYFKLGASLSALSGVTYTLSSASVPSANVYSDIEDIIDRLPKVVTCPIVIEIAKYGDLGELNLQGIEFEDGGGLLVRNLVYSHTGSGLAGGDDSATVLATASLGQWPDGNPRTLITQVSAPIWTDNLTNAQTTNPNFSGVSVHSDSSLSANYRLFLERRKHSSLPINIVMPDRLHMDIESSNFVRSGDTYTFSGYTNERDLSISGSDVNKYWQNSFDTTRNLETDTTWFAPSVISIGVNGLIYGNYFTSVRVGQCGGTPFSIILSGICVDGGQEYVDPSSLTHSTEVGFHIGHSMCHISDCFATRCSEVGWLILNSKVFVPGSMGAARIYNPSWNGTTLVRVGEAVGVYLRNSEMEFPTSGNSLATKLFTITRCDTGMEVYNSNIRGGNQTTEDHHLAQNVTPSASTITLAVYQNNEDGIQLVGSVLDTKLIWMVYSNGRHGIRAESSQLRLSQYLITHNFGRGIELHNSELVYGTNGCFPNYGSNLEFDVSLYGTAGAIQIATFHCTHNGLNIMMVGSSLVPYKDSDGFLPDNLGAMNNHTGSWSYGATASGVGCNMPYMILDNSFGEFVNFYGSTFAGKGVNPGRINGAICQCRNNSTARFIGTKKAATVALGTANEGASTAGFHGTASNLEYFQRMAGFCAQDNSKIEFNGPTKIFYFGVGVLAENNSVIRFGPQIQSGQVVAQKWELSATGNHTKVDLHSTRAGIVAIAGSKVCMEYLGNGDYTPAGGGEDNFSDGLPYTTASYVSGGYFQFYPNPYVETMGDDSKFNLNTIKGQVNVRNAMITADQVSATYGGMCVRALNSSEVRVNHVNFPMGIDTTLLSGVYYDLSTTCWWPFIWNFADTSRLIAENVSISGSFDGEHGYHGPSGTWPGGIPIDWYGASGPRELYNNDAGVPKPKVQYDFENFGPFRLYFSIDPIYRNYVTTGSTDSGMVIHSLCQGYLPSGLTLSAYPGTANAYKHNFEISGAGAFAITSGIVSSIFDGEGHHRNLVDETGLNAWANAKHCTEFHVNMVGVIKGTRDPVGEGSDHAAGHGLGVRSIHTFDLGRQD